ncbi:hypothetical protein CVIRNUC_003174 [Coccomyxa viridis]|uniref:Cytochrome P450 n=1 Tax=Coccomyxa viridis TaxID=1274662 RepID=A0AAV1HXT8_9CHLO|nr:hypothetical protein CVIRNUC_003174 [Coccomyxa viridis]
MSTDSFAIWLLGLAALVSLVFLYGLHPVTRWKYRQFPGPPPTWLFGNIRDIIKKSAYHYYIEQAQVYGKLFKVWYGATPVIVVTDATLGRAVNLRNPNRHTAIGPATILQGKDRIFESEGILLTKDREFHRSIRNAWNPAFFSQSLEGYASLMNSGADGLVRRLAQSAAKSEEIDIWRTLGDMTMAVVGSASFGVDFRTQSESSESSAEAKELVHAAQTIFQQGGAAGSMWVPIIVMCPPLLPVVRQLAMYFPDKKMLNLMHARRTLKDTCEALLRQVRQQIASSNGAAPAGKPERGVAPGSFLHHLATAKHHPSVRNGDDFTDMEILQQAFGFLLGGYETTASALGFTIYSLAANPDKAAKLMQEVDAFGRDREPGRLDIEQLPYVQACFKEALRLFPPGHIAIREAVEDLDLDGHFVPKGTWIHVSICGIHRDPKVWGNPDEYTPERWVEGSPLEATDAQKKAFMPFGDGIRACVGKRFAWEEALIALIRIYQKIDFKLSPGQVPLAVRSPFTLGPSKGIFVTPILRVEE